MIRILAFDDLEERTHQGKGLIMQLRRNDVNDRGFFGTHSMEAFDNA